MNQNKGIWIGVVSLIVIAALGLWWLSASRPLGILGSLSGTSTATQPATTSAATAPATTGSSTASIKKQVKKLDVVSIVKSISSASTFNAYFVSTGVAKTINPKSTSKYTIFVPTNGAFAQLPDPFSRMSAADKLRLIQYHVVSGRAVDPDQMTAGTIQALSGDMLNFSYGPTKIPMVNSAIVIAQYEGTNGVVIVIDNVLLPPKKTN